LIKLLAPLGFLPLLAPWVAVLALPAFALNFLSADPSMYSAKYQYNTDIAAILVVAAIDALAWIIPLALVWINLARRQMARADAPRWLAILQRPWVIGVALAIILVPALVVGLGPQAERLNQKFAASQGWPAVTAHDQLGETLAADIPQDASVSAQSTLTPHVSERAAIYQFPSGDTSADYVFVDVKGGDSYPFPSRTSYLNAIKALVQSGNFQVVTANDGYLLLRRAPGAGVPQLPPGFFP
jgi:uncharacterized membrane protein